MKKNITVKEFMSSLSFDIRLAPFDITGSIAHAKMLAKCGIISSDDSKSIIKGLQEIAADIKKGKPLPDEEDIHMAIEKELIKRIGSAGGRLHTARSRNDQVALDIKLYMKDCIIRQKKYILDVQKEFVKLAQKNGDIVMPGMTHLQHAQPILLAHHLLAYAWMLQRDKERLSDCMKRMDQSPLGSAAFAGTSFPIDRKYTAQLLGFAGPTDNSIDAVSDRDFIVEYLSASALAVTHMSRLAEDLVVWSSQAFSFVKLGDAFTSGSSIMPQKKNPDFAEIIRGKTGRIYGNLVGMLSVLKGLPLTYNRDLQEDKPLLFDTTDTLDHILQLVAQLLPSLQFNKERMLASCADGYLEATELADDLVRKGLSFRKAHGIIRELVEYCIKKRKKLSDVSMAELQKYSKQFNEDSLKLLNPRHITDKKTSYGGTAGSQVKQQIQKLQKLLS